MATFFATRHQNPDPAFVLALEERLLGKKVPTWNRWLLWISLPSLTTAALVAALFVHITPTAKSTIPDQENISSISQELNKVEQDNIGTLNAIEQQLDL